MQEFGRAGISYTDGCTLLRRATRLQRSSEARCSFEMSERDQKRLEDRDKRDEQTVAAIAGQYGLTADFQGDPRGCPFTLLVENQAIYVPGRGYPARVFAC